MDCPKQYGVLIRHRKIQSKNKNHVQTEWIKEPKIICSITILQHSSTFNKGTSRHRMAMYLTLKLKMIYSTHELIPTPSGSGGRVHPQRSKGYTWWGRKMLSFCSLECIFAVFPFYFGDCRVSGSQQNFLRYRQGIWKVPSACLEGTRSMSRRYPQRFWRAWRVPEPCPEGTRSEPTGYSASKRYPQRISVGPCSVFSWVRNVFRGLHNVSEGYPQQRSRPGLQGDTISGGAATGFRDCMRQSFEQ